MNLYSQYVQILSNRKLWNYNSNGTVEADIKTLFNSPYAFNFIKRYMFYSGKIRALPWSQIYKSESFEDRASHTVSLFLLGISATLNLGIAFDDIPRYYPDPYKNFLYLWSTMCLYHDIGYFYENHHAIVEECPTINDFIKYGHIEYKLLDIIDDNILSEKYYKYRLYKYNKVDHGIAGGLLMYDRLMKDISEQEKLYKQCVVYVGDTRRFSDTSRDTAKVMSHAILRHNMWFNNSDEYKKAGLGELVPKPDNSHKYYFKDNSLLFLLCLLDTIEPMKRNLTSCLKTTDITFDAKDKELTINIIDDSIDVSIYFDNIKNLEDWLQVHVDINKHLATIKII